MEKVLVMADDFTGAAEIAGIGLRYGLAGEIFRGPAARGLAGRNALTIVDTDSRALPAAEAAACVGRAMEALVAAGGGLVFKKIDSVLRGPVVAEVDAALAATGREMAIVLPANPSRGRIIRGGRYYVAGVALDQTEFGLDPMYAARTANVVERVGGAAHVRNGDAASPLREGITIGDAETLADVRAWAARVTPEVLAVGGADFFTALLERAGHVPVAPRSAPPPALAKSLLVCGTASAASVAALLLAEGRGAAIRGMPAGVFAGDGSAAAEMAFWRETIVGDLERVGRAIVAVRQPLDQPRWRWVAERLADVVAGVVSDVAGPCELFVEGGSTAAGVAERMGWRCFSALRELAPGVVCLAIAGKERRWLTIKPGSYAWPEGVWERLLQEE